MAGLFTSFRYLTVDNTDNYLSPVKNQKVFYLATRTPSLSILDIVKFLRSRILESDILNILETLEAKG